MNRKHIAAVLILASLALVGYTCKYTTPTDPASSATRGELVSTQFFCGAGGLPIDARLWVWLTSTISVEMTCVEGQSEIRDLGLVGRDRVHVTGVVAGEICPVSPCPWVPFNDDVQLVEKTCPVSPCGATLIGIVNFHQNN